MIKSCHDCYFGIFRRQKRGVYNFDNCSDYRASLGFRFKVCCLNGFGDFRYYSNGAFDVVDSNISTDSIDILFLRR